MEVVGGSTRTVFLATFEKSEKELPKLSSVAAASISHAGSASGVIIYCRQGMRSYGQKRTGRLGERI